MNRRWYDKEPAMSLAISILKAAPEQERSDCANMIIDFCKKQDIKLQYNTFETVEYTLKRWHDKDKVMFDLIEYIRVSPDEIKKEIISKIIEFLQDKKPQNV